MYWTVECELSTKCLRSQLHRTATALHSAVSINVVYQPVSKCLVEDGKEEGASHPLNRQDSRHSRTLSASSTTAGMNEHRQRNGTGASERGAGPNFAAVQGSKKGPGDRSTAYLSPQWRAIS